jgi:hypothetical protein
MTSRRAKSISIVFAMFVALGSAETRAQAQTPTCDEVDKLRKLFDEAYKEEQEKHYESALEKFRTVEKCKASASVRYRVGAVLEAMGKLREARDSFRSVAADKGSLPPNQVAIATSAEDRANQLEKRIPKIILKMPADAGPDTTVTIDDKPVGSTSGPIEVDPGEHVVRATSPTAKKPFEGRVKLGESGEITLPITLDGTAEKPPPPPPPPPPPSRNDTLAYIALGGGAVFLAGGIVMLIVRKGDINDINNKCPNNVCPTSAKTAVEDDRSQAKLFGPLGVGFIAVGAAAAGLGAYLLFRPTSSSSSDPSSASPTTPPPSGSLRIEPRWVRGGGILGVERVF